MSSEHSMLDFDILLSCNLTKGTYEATRSQGLSLLNATETGSYESLIGRFATITPFKYSKMLTTCFSTKALLTEFNANSQHTFQNAFFKYISDNTDQTKWAGIVSCLKYSDSGDVLATIYIHSVESMYNEWEIRFVSESAPTEDAKIIFDYNACKMGLILDTGTGHYSAMGGTMVQGSNPPIPADGEIHSAFVILGALVNSEAEKSLCFSENLVSDMNDLVNAYGGYYFKRFQMDIAGSSRWHELALMALDEKCTQILVTLKDIHSLQASKLLTINNPISSYTTEELQDAFLTAISTSLEDIPTPYCCVALSDRLPILAANSRFYELSGHTKEQFQMMFDGDLIPLCHPADIPYTRRTAKEVIQHILPHTEMEVRMICSNGSVAWVHISARNIVGPKGMLSFMAFENITERKLAEESGSGAQHVFNQTYSKSTNILFDFDYNTGILKDRGGLKDILGFPAIIDDASSLLEDDAIIHPDDRAELGRVLESIRSGAEAVSGLFRIKVPKMDHNYAKVSVTLSALFDNTGMPQQIIGVIDKITAQKEVATSSEEISLIRPNTASGSNSLKADMAVSLSPDMMSHFIINLSTNNIESYTGMDYLGINFPDYTGMSVNETARKVGESLIAESSKTEFLHIYNTEYLIEQYQQNNPDLTNVFPVSHPALTNTWIKVFTHVVHDDTDDQLKALVYACDVSDEYRKISSLVSASSKDPLTGLHNRAHAKELISGYLDDMKPDDLAAFLILDLDNFKEINDIYGHQAGDEYLKDLADALSEYLPDAYLSRLGGDEFIIFLKKCESTSQISNNALSVLKLIKDVNHSRITAFNTTGSIGIALAPSQGHDFETLYRCADKALYEVKNSHKDGFMYFDDVSPNAIHHSNTSRREIIRGAFSGIKGTPRLLMVVLLISILASIVITGNLYQRTSADVYHQAGQDIISHSDYMYKHTSLFLSSQASDIASLAQFAGQHFNDMEFRDLLDHQFRKYDYSEAVLYTKDGNSEYYHYGKTAETGSTMMLNDALLFNDHTLPSSILKKNICRGVMVLSHPVRSNGQLIGYLVCYTDANTVSQYLADTAIYEDEDIYLANRNGIIISGSDSNMDDLWKYNHIDYLAIHGYALDEDLLDEYSHFDSIRNPSVKMGLNDCLLITTSIATTHNSATEEFKVISIIPQNSMLSGLNYALRELLALIVLCLFTIMVLGALFAYNARKKDAYVDSLAYKDSLTNLNNMNYLVDNSKPLIKLCGEPSAIVSINIDNFRIIKDAYGPAKSNKLITCMGNAIADFIDENESAARNVDDRYCLILSYVGEDALLDKLKDLRTYIFSSCATYMATPISFSLSMGVYICESADESLKQSYEMAELARSYFKEGGSDGIYFYNVSLQHDIQRQKIIEDSLDAALENGEFLPYYQPIVDVYSRRIVGAEALTRWLKPDGTMVSPAEFIPLLEKHGTIVTLDYYIFERVCAQLQLWKDTALGGISISVNMSRQHFYQPDFIERLTRTTAKYAIPNSRIHIEITESIYVGDDALIDKVMLELRDNGFLISMDDFGTGYSSMSMLQKMPIDILKIDKQFLDSSLASDHGIIVLEGIVNIAKQLGLKTICEGVDSTKQINWLKTVGCDMIQGFYYSKPLGSLEFENYFIDYLNNNN